MSNLSSYTTILVEGRTPGPRGEAPMVTLQNGVDAEVGYEGTHHKAVYLAAVVALAKALEDGEPGLIVETPSDHLVEQMNGRWKVGDELVRLHDLLVLLAGLFPGGVTWRKAPRSDA